MIRLFSFEDEMLPVKMELNRKRKLLGIGEVVFASGDWRRIESEYTGFVIQVLDDLEVEGSGVQRALSFDQVSVTVKRTACRPERPGVDRRKRARRAKAPPDIQSSSALKRGWDDRLRASYQLYGAVRRHLWRPTSSMNIRTASPQPDVIYGGIWKGSTPPASARSPKHSYAGGCFGRHVGHRAIYSRRCARIRSALPDGWPPAPPCAQQLGRGKRSNGSRTTCLAELAWPAFGIFWTSPCTTGNATASIGMDMP